MSRLKKQLFLQKMSKDNRSESGVPDTSNSGGSERSETETLPSSSTEPVDPRLEVLHTLIKAHLVLCRTLQDLMNSMP